MTKNWVIMIALGVAIALGVTLFSPWASGEPDGLERVAEDKEFIDEGKGAPYEVIAGYVFPGVENERVATILAGVVGVLTVTAVSLGAGLGLWAVARSRTGRAAQGQHESGGSGGAGG